MTKALCMALLTLGACVAYAAEYHVSVEGDDTHDGSAARPLRTISVAAERAMPGDTVTVHAGTYRERIDPPRGGESDDKRIVYRAAPGDEVFIKGSEIVKGWEKVEHDTWKVAIPNGFFGNFNPYSDLIKGDWFYPKEREHHTGAVYLHNHWLTEAAKHDEVLQPADDTPLWFAKVDDNETTIWAQFKGVDPNEVDVEINVRQTVFYPEKPGINYITVRGFKMMHAATNWAPPTAEQVGLIGTHWSKGWIIENNDICYSVCTAVTLGKYGDEFDNTSQNTAEGYVETIKRATARGWSKANIGHHIVRDNRISHCEQAGIVGSMGPVFSKVTRNEIHDIHVRRLFTGAEMAGIKFHGAIDTEISHNIIYRTTRGIWLDWMTQGTLVTRNVLFDNGPSEDLFVEVNHGPFLIEHNLLLSPKSLLDYSQGGAFAHNLFAGRVTVIPEKNRETPYHKPHSTEVAGLHNIPGGDHRYYNNIFLEEVGLSFYDNAAMPMHLGGNVFLKGSKPAKAETSAVVLPDFDPGLDLARQDDGLYLQMKTDKDWADPQRNPLVTTELLGKAKIPDLPYVRFDDSPYRIDTDFFGKPRDTDKPFPGPFEPSKSGLHKFKVWPPKE